MKLLPCGDIELEVIEICVPRLWSLIFGSRIIIPFEVRIVFLHHQKHTAFVTSPLHGLERAKKQLLGKGD